MLPSEEGGGVGWRGRCRFTSSFKNEHTNVADGALRIIDYSRTKQALGLFVSVLGIADSLEQFAIVRTVA